VPYPTASSRPPARCGRQSSGFDWSRINAAVAALPRGRWTTYGDLALLGCTAMPVGQHIANTLGLDNPYRVLGCDGNHAPIFLWTKPATCATS